MKKNKIIETIKDKIENKIEEIKEHPVLFISTLICKFFRYEAGQTVNLSPEHYEIAKKYNAVKDL